MPALRPAATTDLPAVARIFDHHVVHSTATFETRVLGVDPWIAKFDALGAAGRPFLVAEDDGDILGFAYAGRWRERPAYDRTVEESIYLDPAAVGRGLGTRLLTHLLDRLRASDVRVVLAVIADEGAEASLALHQRAGFRVVGHLEQVGEKFGRRLGTRLLQLDLVVT